MKTKYWSFEQGDLKYYRFSVYLGKANIQTVYCYQFGDVLIDTGQQHSRKNVQKILEQTNISKIYITHLHEDHTGNAAFISDWKNAEVFAHPIGAKRLTRGFNINPVGKLYSGAVEKVNTQAIEDNQILELGDYKLKTLYTPGHADDHITYCEQNNGWLFSGDLYVADRIKYFAKYESVNQQMASIEKMLAEDFQYLCCAHNPKMEDGRARLERKLEIFQNFKGEVETQRAKGLKATEILKNLGRKEKYFYKIMTFGGYSAVNMVKSVIKEMD